jgi:peptidoglycan/LPS O-acetylase OafA/YrhL
MKHCKMRGGMHSLQRLPPKRPIGVTVTSLTFLVFAAVAIYILIAGRKLWNSDQYGPMATTLVFLVLGCTTLAIGIYRLKNWARIATLCISAIGLLNLLFSSYLDGGTRVTLAAVCSLWFLYFRAESTRERFVHKRS